MLGFAPPASRLARREGWRRQIQSQNEGSLTVAEFCRRLGVSTVTFYARKRRFRKAPASPLVPERPSTRPRPEANGASTPALLPVSILDAGAAGVIAQRIIEGRPHRSVEELVRVKGIGRKRLEEIRPLVTVE
jgi:hypothetical protein